MNEIKSPLGRITRQPQPTDYPYSVIAKGGVIPPVYKPAGALNLPINNQGSTGSCGGHAAQYRFVKKFFDKLNQYLPLGPRSAYALDKFVDKLPLNQWGTTIQALASEMISYGIALEALFPDTLTLDSQDYGNYNLLTEADKLDALSRATGEQYFFLGKNPSLDTIKNAIYNYGDVILEVEVGVEWYTAKDGATSWTAEDILPIRPPAQIIDGHFIYVPCYDSTSIIFPNSWSAEWGNAGWGYMLEDYVPFITNGVVFQAVPPSVQTTLTTQQWDLATQIFTDLKSVVNLIQTEL
jgi:hypothetical protein